MPFSPVDFTQVNPAMNQVMVRRALGLLQAQATDRVADFFCGLGNFTLPAARFAQKVVGFEGSPSLTQRAMENARLHQLDDRVTFLNANLFDIDPQWLIAQGQFDRVLLDPPREGALALCQAYRSIACELGRADFLPKRIVYVSCNPATLARDAAVLVHEGGWQLKASGVINMFVHTAHVESIAVFERPQSPDHKKSP
jgi:23S rRNA (uracil1939-C5)-methyltransferase